MVDFALSIDLRLHKILEYTLPAERELERGD